jgi:hypothetical protein
MIKFQRQVVRAGSHSPLVMCRMRSCATWLRRWFVFATVFAVSAAASGQAPFAVNRGGLSAFVDGGIQNVQYPSYSDNSLGANVGIFMQPRLLVGLEVRGGSFPVSAKYTQAQVTAGWRVGVQPGSRTWMPYVYGGGGLAKAQDVNATGQKVSGWDPCWQTSVGLDRALGNWSVRLLEVSYRRTYTPLGTLRSAEATTGLVYRF